MWECKTCGHKSGKRMKSSKGCDHEWWDEKELAHARWLETDEGKEWQTKIAKKKKRIIISIPIFIFILTCFLECVRMF